MTPRIVTIGAYGYSEAAFFHTLVEAGVDTFCDVRLRRGMRGTDYAFANSTYLQKRLNELGIRYLHFKSLAPSQDTREKQRREDRKHGVRKRARTRLGEVFIEAYEAECLSRVTPHDFLRELGSEVEVVALFCVEREPEACHRSLIATWLQKGLGLVVEHLMP